MSCDDEFCVKGIAYLINPYFVVNHEYVARIHDEFGGKFETKFTN